MNPIDLTGVKHHPAVEEIVEVICNKVQNTDKSFFRVMVAHYLGVMTSNMRGTIVTEERGEFPVNIFALCLAESGHGKGYSIGIMKSEFMAGFDARFKEDTLPVTSDQNLWKIAGERAARQAVGNVQEEYDKLVKEYDRLGPFVFTFDSGSTPAAKQIRQKLIRANCGALSLKVDEIGLNLSESAELLKLFLELYDQGLVDQKITKNGSENVRLEEMEGKTPTNMLLFGSPTKLLDKGATEDQFFQLLETGYARRCLFAYGKEDRKAFHVLSVKEIRDRMINPESNAIIDKWAQRFHALADPAMIGWRMKVEEEVALAYLTYKFDCERKAEALPKHDTILKGELSHRYMKALKLAGAYAFVDGSTEIEMEHLLSAILLVEESGVDFAKVLRMESNYEKLAQYIASCNEELTHTDLLARLPFYPKKNAERNEMMHLAVTWGYKNNIIIKKNYGPAGIEFFRGETLKESDLSDMIFTYSNSYAYDYIPEENPVSFDQFHVLLEQKGLQWCNHHFKNNHRNEENTIPGFNMLVLDVDDGNLALVHKLLSDFRFLTFTTKRHTPESNRFRLIIPINYTLKLDKEEYEQLVASVIAWLPFSSSMAIDEASTQRAKTWATYENGTAHYNMDAATFDILPFIPKTSKHEEFQKAQKEIASMDSLERWFASKIIPGVNRNQMMIRYALALVDSKLDFITVRKQVFEFNTKLPDPLGEDELDRSIMQTVAKRLQAQP